MDVTDYQIESNESYAAGLAKMNAFMAAVEGRKQQTVTVAKAGGDFTSIQDALDSITDNSISKRYTILLFPGTWSEDFTMKDWVRIKAVDPVNTIITGNITPTVNSDYNSLEGLIPINSHEHPLIEQIETVIGRNNYAAKTTLNSAGNNLHSIEGDNNTVFGINGSHIEGGHNISGLMADPQMIDAEGDGDHFSFTGSFSLQVVNDDYIVIYADDDTLVGRYRVTSVTFENGVTTVYVDGDLTGKYIGWVFTTGESIAQGYSHVEGCMNVENGMENHVEGANNKVGRFGSNHTVNHVEGQSNEILGEDCSINHVEGSSHSINTNAVGNHVEGIANEIPEYVCYTHVEGNRAKPTRNFQFARANGQFGEAGDAQIGNIILRRSTSGSGTFELYVDNNNIRFTLETGKVYNFKIRTVGKNVTDNVGAIWNIEGLVTNFGGTPVWTQLGTTGFQETPDSSFADTDITIGVVDSTTDYLTVSAAGKTGKSIYWVALLEWVEVK